MNDTNPSAAPDALASLLRTIIGAVGGYLIATGRLDTATGPSIVGVAAVLGTAVWGVIAKLVANRKLKAAINSPAGSTGMV